MSYQSEDIINDYVEAFFGVGLTFGINTFWTVHDPDADGKLRTAEAEANLDGPNNTIWDQSGDVTVGFNVNFRLKLFGFEVLNLAFHMATFKLADFNIKTISAAAPPPLAHLGNSANLITGPNAEPDTFEDPGTLYLNTATSFNTVSQTAAVDATARTLTFANPQPLRTGDAVMIDGAAAGALFGLLQTTYFAIVDPANTKVIKLAATEQDALAGNALAIISNAQTLTLNLTSLKQANDQFNVRLLRHHASDNSDDVLIVSNGRSQEFKHVHAIYADGGAGDDTIIIGRGITAPATLHGGNGDDHFEYQGTGDARLLGGAGADSFFSGAGNDTLDGGAGNDLLNADGGNNTLLGGNGDDELFGGSGTSTIFGDDGDPDDDYIEGGTGTDIVKAGGGNDTFVGRLKGGNDVFDGQSGDDSAIINGSTNPDILLLDPTILPNNIRGLFIHFDDLTAGSVTLFGVEEVTVHGGNQGSTEPADGFIDGRPGDLISAGDLTGAGVEVLSLFASKAAGDKEQDAIDIHGTAAGDNFTIDTAVVNGIPAPAMVVHRPALSREGRRHRAGLRFGDGQGRRRRRCLHAHQERFRRGAARREPRQVPWHRWRRRQRQARRRR